MTDDLRCPAGCGRTRRSVDELLCPPCWWRVPADMRRNVRNAYRGYLQNRVTLPTLRAVQRAAVEAVTR